ncbi:MAG: exosortase system-associated protein, TIGR04073 family [Candidatus Omnitrophota bacterium]|nr:exosortase system-associated protein, TIGR04073 family [Candidatus Omnitrophota bacterium]
MRGEMNWCRIVWLAGLAVGVAATDVVADDRTWSGAEGRLRKLGRGVANVVTAPLELIRTPELVSRQDGYLAGMSVGLVQGAWRTAQRVVVGAFEVATSPLEIPRGFQPLVTPEFVFAHGKWAE